MKRINNRTGVWVIIDKKEEAFKGLLEFVKNDNYNYIDLILKNILKWDEVFNDVYVCGSMKALVDFGIEHKGRNMTYDELRARLSKDKPFNNENYFIKYCYYQTSKQAK